MCAKKFDGQKLEDTLSATQPSVIKAIKKKIEVRIQIQEQKSRQTVANTSTRIHKLNTTKYKHNRNTLRTHTTIRIYFF